MSGTEGARRGVRPFTAATVIVVLLALPAAASAATINVDDEADVDLTGTPPTDGLCSLREAVSAARNNVIVDGCEAGDDDADLDTIMVPSNLDDGTFVLTTGPNSDEQDNGAGDLDLYGQTGPFNPGPVKILGTGGGTVTISGNDDVRVFDLHNGSATIENVAVSDGDATGVSGNGGGVRSAGDLILNDVEVSSSAGVIGGGIHANSNLTLIDVTVDSNVGGTLGGGIAFDPLGSAKLTLNDSIVSFNSSGIQGGGIYSNGQDLEINDSVITLNQVTNDDSAGLTRGGGIRFVGDELIISGSTISNNSIATVEGGSGDPTGGGLFANTGEASRVVDSTITGNSATDISSTAEQPAGGGIFDGSAGGPLTIRNSTITSNTVSGNSPDANYGGGGLFHQGAETRVTHTTIANNDSPRGDNLATFGGNGIRLQSSIVEDIDEGTDSCATSVGPITSADYNVAWGTSCGLSNTNDVQEPTNHLGLLTFGDYGGGTDTRPLGSNSTYLDMIPAGDCDDGEDTPAALTSDQRGFGRPFDSDEDGTPGCEPGSVEGYYCGMNITKIPASDSNDVFAGTAGVDIYNGGGGDDQISGGDSNDVLCGAAGNDVLNGGPGEDELNGDAGVDTVSYTTESAEVSASIIGGGSTLGDGNDTYSGIENLTGSSLNDSLSGDAGDNVLSGGDGNDTLAGYAGDDDYLGGAGANDIATFEPAPLTGVSANLATDTASGDGGSAEPLTGIEGLAGSNGPDTLTGGPEANEISGLNGADTINPGGGMDDVSGNDGPDQLLVNDGVADQVDCGSEVDSFLADNSLDTLIACETDLTPIPPPAGSCAGKTATEVGTGGADVLTGTPAADVIDASGGNDTVRGLAGNDVACGKAGNDKLIGGAGNDTLDGGTGRDVLKGGAGRDRLKGKGGRDRCIGGGGRDRGPGCERRGSIP